jgi:hypothetical protein
MMSLIEWASLMKAMILICDLQLGHSKVLISCTRFMHAAQLFLRKHEKTTVSSGRIYGRRSGGGEGNK